MIGTEFINKYKPNPELLLAQGINTPLTQTPASLSAVEATLNLTSGYEDEVESLISIIESSQIDITSGYDTWLRILFAIVDAFGESGRDKAHRISRFNPEYNHAACNKQFDYCLRADKSGITIRTLFYIASLHGIRVENTSEFSSFFDELSINLPLASSPYLSFAPSPLWENPEHPAPVTGNFDSQNPGHSALSSIHFESPSHVTLSGVEGGVETFPVDIFPLAVSRFITTASKSVGCPPDFLAIPVLTVLATAIGNSRSIQLKKGWIEGPRIYSAVVALPGSKKSPALAAATMPIRELQQSYCVQHDIQENDYQLALSAYNIQVEIWKKRKPEDKNPDEQPNVPPEPILKQIKTSNATMEAIGKLLDQNKRGILFEQDELAAWVKSMNAYRAGKGSDLENWLSFWNGSQTIINRASAKKPQIINRPLVNVTGCIQPDLLSDLSGIKQNGFFDRILASFPDPIPQHYSTDELPDEVASAYNNIVRILFDLQPDIDQAAIEVPALMNFTSSARHEWEQWNHKHDEEMNSPDLPYYLQGVWSKLQAYMARFILIIQLTHNASDNMLSREIHPQAVIASATLVRYFKSHIRKIYKELYNSEMDRRVVLAVAWITRKGGKVSQRMLLTNNVGKCASAHQVNELLVELVERNIGTLAKTTPGGGGRSSIIFTLLKPANGINTI